MALDDIQVGDLVNVPGGMYGTVKYLGPVTGKPGRFAGIELAAEHARKGKNSGDVEGRKYFTPSVPGSGIFVPMNTTKYITKRPSLTPAATTTTATTPVTPSRAPPLNFSKSAGPVTPTVPRPTFRRPSMPRPESPRTAPPPKLSVGSGLRTPSAASRTGPSPTPSIPRTPLKTPSRPPSRFSVVEDEGPVSTRTSDPLRKASSATEVQELRDKVKTLEQQLLDRDKQLEEQTSTLAEFQKTMEELEGPDALSIRALLREKNERIAQLTAEFDSHRADFRSTLDTLEVAASETERVYEQRLDQLMQENKELQDREEDVDAIAQQLKQLEDMVSELEEGLADARRGEAEARAEVEFLRGEVERTKLELEKERESRRGELERMNLQFEKGWESSPVASKGSEEGSSNTRRYSKELDQKDDEIRGLKAIIHSLSRGDVNLAILQQPNGSTKKDDGHYDTEHVARLETLIENKSRRIEELEGELEQLRLGCSNRGPNVPPALAPKQHQSTSASGLGGANRTVSHAHRLSDRTVVPNDWQEPSEEQHQGYHHRSISNDSYHPLETMHESDSRSSDDGTSPWCEICETGGHDILSCTMFGTAAGNSNMLDKSLHDESSGDGIVPDKAAATGESGAFNDSNGINGFPLPLATQKTGRDVVLEGLKGIGGLSLSMSPLAGKSSGVIDETKWCALCERDGHESIDCPFDD